MHKILLIIPVIIGLIISIPFIISSQSSEIHFTQEIDPKILEATDGFAISSNMDIYKISLIEDGQSLFFRVSENTDGFIYMDDPLTVLQKIYPENNIVSFQVLIFGKEVPYTLEEGKITFGVNNAQIIEIRGLSENKKTVRVEGTVANQICLVIGGECPPYYPGNIQDDGSVMVGFVISDQEKTKHYQFLIEDDIIIDVEKSADGESKKLGIINPEKDIPIFFEIQLMEQNITWEMPEREWNNPDFEVEPPSRFCSQILMNEGTDVFISTIFQSFYSLSNMTFHETMPNDCVKILPVTQHAQK
jgi:hypothetical protein